MSGRKISLSIFFFGLLVIQGQCQEKPGDLFKILKLPQRIQDEAKIQLSEEDVASSTSTSSSSSTTSAVPETEATTKFSFPPLHGDNTTTSTTTSTTPKDNNSTSFTWPPLHKDNTTQTSTPTKHNTTFTWPPLHTTSAPFTWKQDLIPIIVGASLGGLVVIVLAGYFIARMRNNSQADDRERLVNN